MQTRPLGRSGLQVSAIALGTMTWGNQTRETDAHAQIEVALDNGISFFDSAEVYPVNPMREETIGRSEEVLGSWIARSGRRDAITVATKVAGANHGVLKNGPRVDAEQIRSAVERSLKRLRTDRIDLYQLHWPDRGSYHFRQSWTYDPSGQDRAATLEGIEMQLDTFAALIAEGKIRSFGLSNETAWGVATWARLADARGLPRVAAVQNEYSLLYRTYDLDLAEAMHHEDVALLAYSPLAAGLLTGKYLGGSVPKASRKAINPNLGGRATARADTAVESYAGIAEELGMSLPQMALAWLLARPTNVIPLLGATTTAQLAEVISGDLTLPEGAEEAIAAVHMAHPMPY